MENLTLSKKTQLIKGVSLVIASELIFKYEAFAGTASQLTGVYTWLKPVVNAVLIILTLVFAGRCLYKIAFKHEQATADIAMFITFFVFWGLWATLASEILGLFGVSVQF